VPQRWGGQPTRLSRLQGGSDQLCIPQAGLGLR
jgi:hypothetical protein